MMPYLPMILFFSFMHVVTCLNNLTSIFMALFIVISKLLIKEFELCFKFSFYDFIKVDHEFTCICFDKS